ncbi:hypothetical protein KFK09_002151 [Dendrobium nobile]|uniref:Uncharacterized protein n=1 Tax=Dendrobium nobile TaxID=94219 RepID=A0A8T3C9G8_DENNO|nr:hypothetical protein KFK09_002151 [Dendrobium nobile]
MESRLGGMEEMIKKLMKMQSKAPLPNLFHLFCRGVLKVNQFIEVRPGIVMKDEIGNIKCTPIFSWIVSLFAEQNELQFVVPGRLIGAGTSMDPTMTRADRLVGQILGEVNSLPETLWSLRPSRSTTLQYFIMWSSSDPISISPERRPSKLWRSKL